MSPDGTTIVSDPGFGLPRLAWHWACDEFSCVVIDEAPPAPIQARPTGGDPVDLYSGRFRVTKTDLVLPGRIPIRIERTYWSGLSRRGFFGTGWNLEGYDLRLTPRGTSMVLLYPDQSRLVFRPAGTDRWVNDDAPALRGAELTKLAGEFNFQLRYKDGTVQRFDRIVGFATVAGLAQHTDRTGNTVTLARTSPGPGPENFGLITGIIGPTGRSLTLTYDSAGRITRVTDPLNRAVQYGYDAQGRLETVTDPASGVSRYAYDAQHRIVTITDARNIPFLTNEYAANGRVIRQTQADGGVWQFDYALLGRQATQTTLTNPRGHQTTYRWDGQGLLLGATDALGQTTTHEYQPGTNLLVATTDPLGRTTRFTYDAAGNVASITDPAGNPTTLAYHPVFNGVTSLTDALNQTTRFEYDAEGNLTATVNPLTQRTTIAYNGVGQPVSVTDPLLHTTTFGYDADGNLATVTDPVGNVTRRAYDAAARLIRQTDPLNQPTQFQYDGLNRLTQIVDALGGVTGFGYDPNGNLLTVTDARTNVTTHTYDSMDRLASRTDPSHATETFGYDAGGNLTQHVDRKGQPATFGYDALNRRTTATYVDAAVNYSYDAIGRLLQVADTAGGTIINAYDPLDRLIAQTQPVGAVSYRYDVLGRRTRMDASGAAPVFYGYDAASRLTSVTQAPLAPATFEYDAAGRRTKLSLPNQVSTEYHYDLASRLTALIYRHATTQLGTLTYSYDPAGNRTGVGGTFARTLLPDAVATATYGPGNRQLAFGNQTMTFDANGNTTSISGASGTTTLTWDARNRLTALEGGGPTATFTYSAGRRETKTVSGNLTRYFYDGADAIQQLDVAGATAYLRSLAIDELVALTSSQGTAVPLADALGSTLAMIESNGGTTAQYTYAPFGATELTAPTYGNPFQFTGRENDTSLYYYRARYYHPGLQRFIGEDPLRFSGGDPNIYAYVGNMPTAHVDPQGLFADVLLDVGFIAYDLTRLVLGGRKELAENLTALSLDVVGAIVPFASGLGPAYRVGMSRPLLNLRTE